MYYTAHGLTSQAFLEDVGAATSRLQQLVKADSPLAKAIQKKPPTETAEPQADQTKRGPDTANEMRSHLFQMEQKGFAVGGHCCSKKNPKDTFEIITMFETGMQVCMKLEGQRAGESQFIDSKQVLTGWRLETRVQKIVEIRPDMLPSRSSAWEVDASKAVALLALRSKSIKLVDKNHSALTVLTKPNAVKCKRPFDVGELKIMWLSPCSTIL